VPPARSYHSGGIGTFVVFDACSLSGLGAIVIAGRAIFTRRLSIARARIRRPLGPSGV